MPTPVSLTTGSSTSNQTSYTTASISPTAGRLLLCAVGISVATAPTPTPTVTGCGVTWELIDTPSTAVRTVYLFRAMGTPTSGALTISGGSTTLTSGYWNVSEVPDVDTSGTNGSGAIAQVHHGRPASATALSSAFPTTPGPGNGAYAAVFIGVQETITPGSGWSLLGQGSESAPTSSLMAMGAGVAPQTVAASWTTSAVNAFFSVEIKGSSAPAFTAAAALGGSGSLAATASAPNMAQAAALSGAGSLSTTQKPATTRSAALGGSGTLSTSQKLDVDRAAALAGDGTLTTTQRIAVAGAAALDGSGTLSAITRPGWVKPATLSGAGLLAADVFGFAGAQLSGSGTLSTTQRLALARAAALSGSGTLAVALFRSTHSRPAALAGSGLLAVITPTVPQGAYLTGAGYLSTGTFNLLRLGLVQPTTFRIGGNMPLALYLGNVLVWRP